MKNALALALLVPLAACAPEGEDFDYATFEAGTFQFTNTGVDDGCYDGSFDVIFMPEGTASDWDTTTELPGWADLPATYDLALPAPFHAMSVTVSEQGEGVMGLADAAQPEPVVLDEQNFPNCYVELVISADLTIVDADHVQGTASLESAGFDADPTNCPQVTADPCTITLDLSAARVQ